MSSEIPEVSSVCIMLFLEEGIMAKIFIPGCKINYYYVENILLPYKD